MQNPKTWERDRGKNGIKELTKTNLIPLLDKMSWSDSCSGVGGNVLDYGCGPGSTGFNYVLPKVLETNSTLHSVDVSKKMIDFAKDNYSDDKINYAVGDILEEDGFPFKDVKFDKIVACHVLHLMNDITKALKGFKSILKNEGQLAFLSFSSVNTTFDVFKELQRSEKWENYMKGYDRFYPAWGNVNFDKLEALMHSILQNAGFQVNYLETKKTELRMSTDMALDVFLGANPCIGEIPGELHAELKEDMRRIATSLTGLPLNSKDFVIYQDYIAAPVAALEKKSVGAR